MRVKPPVPASIGDENIKKEQFVFLKEFKCLTTANSHEIVMKIVMNSQPMITTAWSFLDTKLWYFANFSYSGDVLSIPSTVLPFWSVVINVAGFLSVISVV